MDAISDSFLLFGRASLGATIGLAIGWPTQGERHVRWVIGWVLAGYFIGIATMWPNWGTMLISALLLIPCTVGTTLALGVGAATLGTKEDWWLRLWAFGGFLVTFHLFAWLGAAITNIGDD